MRARNLIIVMWPMQVKRPHTRLPKCKQVNICEILPADKQRTCLQNVVYKSQQILYFYLQISERGCLETCKLK
jgi:hypothetical protein